MTTKRKTPEQIRKDITEAIIASIEKGTPAWRQPWADHPNGGAPRNFLSKRRYSGINVLWLWLMGEIKGYDSQLWGTEKSWTENVGCTTKGGEDPMSVILFTFLPLKDKKTGKPQVSPSGKEKTFPLLREYPVFNAEQMEAPSISSLLALPLPKLLKTMVKYVPRRDQPGMGATDEEIALAIHQSIARKLNGYKCVGKIANSDPDFAPAEELMAKTKANIIHGGGKACWNSLTDAVRLPSKRIFESIADYYQTAMHELIHWTQNPKRVGEKTRPKEEGAKAQYAFNELVAEIGACFVLAELGLPKSEKMLPQTAAYVESWLKAMKNDVRFIFEASNQASKAADYLLAFVGKANPLPKKKSKPAKGGKPAKRQAA
jgi:antirestriction protein ArdC